ncbi:hypothetical protein [Spirillospora sp. CA-128828]|uniref:hypothetical protein n=1 Tax=Spirillospora sp. CA-128828 TaxID=3240033 RepID=UPI003D8DACAE
MPKRDTCGWMGQVNAGIIDDGDLVLAQAHHRDAHVGQAWLAGYSARTARGGLRGTSRRSPSMPSPRTCVGSDEAAEDVG